MDTRICKICKQEKKLEDFAKNGKCRRYICKKCESNKILEKCHITIAYVQTLKKKCEICGYDRDKSALEFHHVDEKNKSFNISSFAAKRIWSKKTKELIDKEVKKCKCLCANCHREIHSNEISKEELAEIDFSFKEKNRKKIAQDSYNKKAHRKFSKEEIKRIRELAKIKSHRQIAKEIGCHHRTIDNIINLKTYSDIL